MYDFNSMLGRQQVYNEDGVVSFRFHVKLVILQPFLVTARNPTFLQELSTESSVRYSYTPVAKTECASKCMDRTDFIKVTKEEIRKEILRKLNLKAPPNVSRDMAPEHAIEEMKKKYKYEMDEMVQGDQPQGYMEEDDFHFQTHEITIMAQNGEYLFFFCIQGDTNQNF